MWLNANAEINIRAESFERSNKEEVVMFLLGLENHYTQPLREKIIVNFIPATNEIRFTTLFSTLIWITMH